MTRAEEYILLSIMTKSQQKAYLTELNNTKNSSYVATDYPCTVLHKRSKAWVFRDKSNPLFSAYFGFIVMSFAWSTSIKGADYWAVVHDCYYDLESIIFK